MTRFRSPLAIAAVTALTAGHAAADDGPDLRARKLADYFYDRGLFYRAITAYEELQLFVGEPPVRHYAGLRIGLSYHRARQASEAVAAYDRLLAAPDLEPSLVAGLPILRILARADAAAEAPQVGGLYDLAGELRGLPLTPRVAYERWRVELATEQFVAARTSERALTGLCAAAPEVRECDRARREHAWAIPYQSPRSRALAVALSVIVPGLGSAYAAHPFDALYYFGLTTGSALVAWDVYQRGRSFGDQKASFYVMGGLAATFYLASVTQAYFAVKRHAAAAAYRRRVAVMEATRLPLPLVDYQP